MSNVGYTWTEGFALKIPAADVKAAIDELPEPSPEALYDAAKDRHHILHGVLWKVTDREAARRYRIDLCQKIISSIKRVTFSQSIRVETREYEWVSNSRQWKTIDDIAGDPEDWAALISDTARSAEQFGSKLRRLLTLRPGDSDVTEALKGYERARSSLERISRKQEAASPEVAAE